MNLQTEINAILDASDKLADGAIKGPWLADHLFNSVQQKESELLIVAITSAFGKSPATCEHIAANDPGKVKARNAVIRLAVAELDMAYTHTEAPSALLAIAQIHALLSAK